MDGLQAFEIRMAPEAEPGFLALSLEERGHIRTVIEGLAEVTALSPPHFPAWFRRWGLAAPVMRLDVAGVRISYELDCDGRALRICGVEDPVRATVLPDGSAAARPASRVSFL